MQWQGVIPAITTPFNRDLSIDDGLLARHAAWLIENGCTGVVALGSLGEAATLDAREKQHVLETCRRAIGSNAHVVAGISALSTREAVSLAQAAESAGCDGLMILPPYVYAGDRREMKQHVSAVLSATRLPCMLYNNPIAYQTDFLPAQVAELLRKHPNLQAIKESSADVRRVAALRAAVDQPLQILCGVDDLIVEAVLAGAVGWIAGLANAFPAESVELFERARQGMNVCFELYSWFLPLLRFDTAPKFVQLIKLVQQQAAAGTERVRPPRLELTGDERTQALEVIAEALAIRAHPGDRSPLSGL